MIIVPGLAFALNGSTTEAAAATDSYIEYGVAQSSDSVAK
jgi:hypothetical protein